MKFTTRLKFFIGVIVVLVIVGLLVSYLVYSMSVAHSSKAVLAADASTIGTDYAGLIVKQNVEEGDKVQKGQTLFEIKSAQLESDLANRVVLPSSLPFSLNPDNDDILLKASDDGVVQKINYRQGSFVPIGGIVATVNTVGSLYVVANFKLSPPDYARISKDSKLEVTFPDNTKMQATVFSITLAANGDHVDTVVKARLKNADISDFRFSVDTPVQATLQLSTAPWYQILLNGVRQLFQPSAGQ
ncbi:MAG TPA: HlyD family efflux transporter periplasmic adaptor subunit [Dongiaceae bacterium]|nr:HlyD family efflux transporter periplasmic adaptor subunit [Dongiaceae bacterium]